MNSSVSSKILLAFFLCLVVFAVCTLAFADGLSLQFELPPDAEGHEIRMEPENVVRLSGQRLSEEEETLSLRFEPAGEGEAIVSVLWDGLNEASLYAREVSFSLRVLPFGIILDSATGNFTGWEYLAPCFSLFCLCSAAILFFESDREKKRSSYSYRSIRLLGLGIFFLSMGLFRLEYVTDFLKGENTGTVWMLLIGLASSAQTFVRWSAWILGGFALVTAVSNLVLIRHEGARPANMLGIGVSAVIVAGALLGIRLSRSLFIFPLRNALCNIYAGLFVYFICLLAATVIRAVEAGRHEPDYDKDFVIILGCRIRPDGSLYPLLRGRVDRALAFVRKQEEATGKRAILIPSGGRGEDEPMPEAEAMARYLAGQGIPEDRILPENRSATTKENLLFSRALTEQQGEGKKAAFSTSSYHVCRGGILAEEMGWSIDGMGSRTRWYFWPNAFLREFIGLLAESWVRQLTAVCIIAAASAGLTMIM